MTFNRIVILSLFLFFFVKEIIVLNYEIVVIFALLILVGLAIQNLSNTVTQLFEDSRKDLLTKLHFILKR